MNKKAFKNLNLRLVSALTAFFFLVGQSGPVSAQILEQLIPDTTIENPNTKTITPEEAKEREEKSWVPSEPVFSENASTEEFVSEKILSETEVEEEKKEPEEIHSETNPYEQERYSFDDALDLFRPEYASAAVLKEIREEDIARLLELPFEVGLAVIEGELVMFSSGDASEIDGLGPVERLLAKAQFMAHTHPQGYAKEEGPSGADIRMASGLTEYVISRSGVYAYARDGVKNEANPFSYRFLAAQIARSLGRASASSSSDPVLARQALNEFIAEMDRLNHAAKEERRLLRSGAVIAPNPNLGSGNVTTLPSKMIVNSKYPTVLRTGGSTFSSLISQQDSTQVHMDYDVSSVFDFAGISLNYDDFGTDDKNPNTTSDVETQDFSNISSLTFGLGAGTYKVKVEFVDDQKHSDYFLLSGVRPNQQFYQLDLALLAPTVNRSKIQAINFVVDRSSASPANRVGSLDLTVKGLEVSGLQRRETGLTLADVRELPLSSDNRKPGPVLIGNKHMPGSKVTQSGSGQAELTYNLTADDAYAVMSMSFDNFGTNPAVETGDLTSLANQELIVGITGPAGSNVRVEFEDYRSTKTVPRSDYLNLGPLDGSKQFFRLKLNLLDTIANTGVDIIDLKKIKGINFVVDKFTADPAANTAFRTGKIEVELKGLDVTGLQSPDPNLTSSDVKALPANSAGKKPGPVLVGDKHLPGSKVTQTSPGGAVLDYDITQKTGQTDTSFAGMVMSFDDTATDDGNAATLGDVEFGDLTTLANQELVIGITGPAGSHLRVEFEDQKSDSKSQPPKLVKDSLLIGPLTGSKQFYKLNLSLLEGIDLKKIKGINFVVDKFTADPAANTAFRTGKIEVELKGLDVTGLIPAEPGLNASNITTLTGNPGPVRINSKNATASIQQNSRDTVTLDYNVTPVTTSPGPPPVIEHQFAGILLNYDDFNTTAVKESKDLSSFSEFIFGLSGTKDTGVQVVFEDETGKKDTLALEPLGAAEQFYRLKRSLIDSTVDFTKITGISFVVDDFRVPNPAQGPYTGTLTVRSSNLSVTGFIPPSTGLTAADVTEMPLPKPMPLVLKPAGSPSTISQTSPDGVDLNYDITASGSFAGVSISYDNPLTPQTVEVGSLAGKSEIIVGLKGLAGTNVRVEFEDASGVKDFLNLGGITTTEQFYRLNLSFLNKVNLSQIRGIHFIVDQGLITNTQSRQGTLSLNLKRLKVSGLIPPTAGLTASNVTSMPNFPEPILTGGSSAASSVNQLSSSQVNLNYNVTQSGSFAGITVNYDKFATTNVLESENLSAKSPLVVGLTGPAGTNVRVEFRDSAGNKDFLTLGFLGITEQFYKLDLSFLNGVDTTKISAIHFIVDGNLAASQQGVLGLRLKDLKFTGFLSPDTTLTAANVTSMPNQPIAGLTSGSSSASIYSQPSSSQANLAYDVTQAGSFSGITVSYDKPLTSQLESHDFSSTNEIIAGLKGPAGTNVRVEFKDKAGKTDSVKLGSVTTTEQFYRIPLSLITAVDLKQIVQISFVVDGSLVTDKKNVLNLRLANLAFSPSVPLGTVSPKSSLTQNDLTTLPGKPQSILVGGSSDKSSIAQVSTSRVDLDYDVSAAGSFSGAGVTFDNFLVPGVETQDLSGVTNLVVGVRGQNGDKVRLEIEDGSGSKASFLLVDVKTTEQFYELALSSFTGVDLKKVRFIHFIVDKNQTANPTGVLRFRVKELSEPSLTSQEETLRQNFIKDNLSFFKVGTGIDANTHFPFDHINAQGTPQKFTQPTAIGFYLQVLGDIANGKISSTFLNTSGSLTEAGLVLDNLISAQTSFGWNGLLPFLNLSPLGPQTTTVGFGDNANLAQSLAVFIGALQRGTFSAQDQVTANALITKANAVLAKMEPGFKAFLDPTFGIFRGSVNTTNGQFSAFIDRLMNEFRVPVAFVVLFYGINQSAWNNLVVTKKNYTDSGAKTVENNVPFDGGAFQVFWSLMRANEEKIVEILPSLKNFLYSTSDFSRKNNIPGFVSASSIPEGGYQGLLGIPALAEINPNVLAFDIGSTYALAAAFAVAPSFVLSWLESIKNQLPALSGPFGLFDSARSATEFNQNYFAIDQASIVLGLSDASGDDFDTFLANRGLANGFAQLYERLAIGLKPNQNPLPIPPSIPSRTLTVLNNFSSEGAIGNFQNPATDLTGISFNYSNLNTKAGHFWKLKQFHDAVGETLVIRYSAQATPKELEIELAGLGNVVGTFTVSLPAGSGVREATLQLPNTSALRAVDQMNVHVNPAQTGVTAADFKIHQLTFRFFNQAIDVNSDSNLTASNVTAVPGFPSLIVTGGSTAAATVNQISDSRFDLNFNNAAAGQYGGAGIDYANAQDFSSVSKIVLGLASAQAGQVKAELIDASGNRAVYNLKGVSGIEKFWSLDMALVPPGFDRKKIKLMNLIVDQVTQGTLAVRSGGILFIPQISPNSNLTAANVTTLPTAPGPQVTRTGGSSTGSEVKQPSASEITLNYTNANAGEYAGITLTYDDFGTVAIEVRDLSSVTSLVLGLAGNPLRVKLEVTDKSGLTRFVRLTGITAVEKFWEVPLASFQGINLKEVRFLSVIVEEQGPGVVTARIQGQQFTPAVTPSTTLTTSDISTLPGFPGLGATGGSSAGTQVNRISSSQGNLSYNVTQQGTYSGLILNYDDFGTSNVESQNLTTLTGSRLVFGVRRTGSGTAPIRVRLELEDASGKRAIVFVDSVTANLSIYSIPFTLLPPGFDLTRARFINFIVDQNGVPSSQQTGTLEVHINGIK